MSRQLMHSCRDETRYGVFDIKLVESSLASPRQAAAYEAADLPAQAATDNSDSFSL